MRPWYKRCPPLGGWSVVGPPGALGRPGRPGPSGGSVSVGPSPPVGLAAVAAAAPSPRPSGLRGAMGLPPLAYRRPLGPPGRFPGCVRI